MPRAGLIRYHLSDGFGPWFSVLDNVSIECPCVTVPVPVHVLDRIESFLAKLVFYWEHTAPSICDGLLKHEVRLLYPHLQFFERLDDQIHGIDRHRFS